MLIFGDGRGYILQILKYKPLVNPMMWFILSRSFWNPADGVKAIQYEHAPLRVRCPMLRKHPPVDPVLSCLSCFRKPSVGVCQVVSNSPDPGIAWKSLFSSPHKAPKITSVTDYFILFSTWQHICGAHYMLWPVLGRPSVCLSYHTGGSDKKGWR